MPAEFKLDPTAVRRCAKGVPDCQEADSLPDDTVLSFLVGLNQTTKSLARVNVYTLTGTIGTCRVLQGQVREIFKRNVSSITAVKKLLLQPPHLTTIMDNEHPPSSLADGRTLSEAKALYKLELAEVGMCILVADREKLQSHAAAATQALVAQQEKDDVSGMDFEFGLPKKVMKQVEQCLHDILNLGKFVTCVATNGKGAIFLYGHGGVAFTPNIPKSLLGRLKQMKGGTRSSTSATTTTRPSYVALGTRDRYYIAFHDGTADWKCGKSLDKTLKHLDKTPRSVAFGDKYDSYFIVFDDGSWEGHGIPEELDEKLSDRSDLPDLVCVTLGPSGEWFLRAKNGRMWWGGISEELDEMIQGLLESERYLNFLDFGEDGAYFLSYD